MTRFILFCAGMTVAALLQSGCRTATPAKRSARAVTPAAASNTVAALPPLDPRAFEQRAEADARFLAGLSHELNNEPELALDDFYKAALADSTNERLVLDLTTRFLFLKRLDRAAELLRKVLDQPGAPATLDTRLAFVLLQMGKTNEAIQVNRDAIRKTPGFIGGYANLFHLYSRTGQTNEANRVLEQAGAVPQPSAEFLVELSEMCFLQSRVAPGTNTPAKLTVLGDPVRSNRVSRVALATNAPARVRALDALKRAADLQPTNFFTLQKLADGFTQLGETKRAAAVLLKLQLLYPDLPNVRERLVNLYLRDRDKKGAAEQLEGLIRDNPTDPQAYYLLGILAFDDHRYQDAADHFRKTLLLKPDFEPAYYELAVCKMNLTQAKEALEVLAQAREKFKETFLSEYFSALAYMRMKDYTNAIQRLTTAEIIASATDTNRLTHIFYFQLGSACERAGRWSEGEQHMLKCLKLSPDFDGALNYLGYMWAERGTNLVQARGMIEKALKAEPDNAAYLDSLGWVLFKQGQTREALKLIQRSIELEKEPDATLYDHLGDIQAELKNADKAREAWRKALTIEPKPEIQRKLNNLKP